MDTSPFSWGHWYPRFGLLVTSVLAFKGRVKTPACMLPYLHTTDFSDSPLVWHLLTVWRSAWQSSLFNPHTCRHFHKHWWSFGAWTHDHPCRMQHARRCQPLGHSGSDLKSYFTYQTDNTYTWRIPFNSTHTSSVSQKLFYLLLFLCYLTSNNLLWCHEQIFITKENQTFHYFYWF